MKKSQASMLLIVLVILIIMGLGIFILSIPQVIRQSEYLDLYGHNLLLSIINTDTGYTDEKCKFVENALRCRFFNPSYFCEPDVNCSEVAEESITNYMNTFNSISENFRYLFIVTATKGAFMEPGGSTLISVRIPDDSILEPHERIDCDPLIVDECPVRELFVNNQPLPIHIRPNECLLQYPDYVCCTGSDPSSCDTPPGKDCDVIRELYKECRNAVDPIGPGTAYLNIQLILTQNLTVEELNE
jgi:hypothetical protein